MEISPGSFTIQSDSHTFGLVANGADLADQFRLVPDFCYMLLAPLQALGPSVAST